LTGNARGAYIERLRYTIKTYSKNIKELGELAGIEVHADPVRLENDDVQLAQAGLHVRFKFDGKDQIGMNDGEASGGQQTVRFQAEGTLEDRPIKLVFTGGAIAMLRDVKPADPSERVEYDFDTSPVLHVPWDWNTQRPELLYYEGSVWYRKQFDFAGLQPGEHAFVRFGAVNYRADVYLNGKKLGVHVGGFTPFSFEVTKLLKPGTNSLVVKVDNKRSKDAVPTVSTDWWNYGGITREVKIVTVPKSFIADHRLTLESETTKTISGWVQIAGAGAGESVELSVPELGEKLSAKTDGSGRAAFHFTPAGLSLWSPETPKLYEVRISHGADAVAERIGFRTVRTQGKQILLNGKPVFLRGICIHEEFSLNGGGRVNSPEKAKQLLLWAKELGCNFVRLAHYPHNEAMTRLADELGILVWSEVPVYWTIDWTNAGTYANAQSQLTDEIQRDANRASIIIWSLANETPVSKPRTKFLTRLAERARSLDHTRLISAAMEKHGKPGAENVSVVQDPLADVVDVVAFNEYTGWYDGLPEKCAKVSWEIPYNKPVFISEFGGDAKQGLHGGKGVQDAMAHVNGEIRDAVTASQALRVYVCNVATQDSETAELDLAGHLGRALLDRRPGDPLPGVAVGVLAARLEHRCGPVDEIQVEAQRVGAPPKLVEHQRRVGRAVRHAAHTTDGHRQFSPPPMAPLRRATWVLT